MSKWTPSLHPRGLAGRFIRTGGKTSLRANTRSVSVYHGRTFPLIPGHANLYLGAVARVERSAHKTKLEKRIDAGIKRAAEALPHRLKQVIQGSGVQFTKPRIRGPQVRLRKGGNTITTRKPRRPRRPRRPRSRK